MLGCTVDVDQENEQLHWALGQDEAADGSVVLERARFAAFYGST